MSNAPSCLGDQYRSRLQWRIGVSPTSTASKRSAAPQIRGQAERTRDSIQACRIALAQTAPLLGDVDTNVTQHLRLIAEAKGSEASLIVFPELSLTGYFLKDLVPEVALKFDSPQLATLAEASTDIDCVVGCVLESDDTRFYNAAIYFSRGQIQHIHRKVYLPTYGLFDESRYLSQGDRFRSFAPTGLRPSRQWDTGMLICEDMWHPSAPGLLARQGVNLMLCISASPGRGVGLGAALGTARSYDAMTRTYAQMYTSFLVYVNRVGFEDGIAFWGGSRVVGPDGLPLGEPTGREEALVYQDIDLGAVRRARIQNPMLRDERHDINDAENDRLRRARD